MTYIFNKNLNQLFVYTMPYHYINSEVYAMLKQILVVVMFLVLLCIGIVAWYIRELCLLLKECWNSAVRFPKENYLCVFRTSIRMNSPGFPAAWIIWQIPSNI